MYYGQIFEEDLSYSNFPSNIIIKLYGLNQIPKNSFMYYGFESMMWVTDIV